MIEMFKLFFAATALSSQVEKVKLESLLSSLAAQSDIAGFVSEAGTRALIMTILNAEIYPDRDDPLLLQRLRSNLGLATGGAAWKEIALLRKERVKRRISQLNVQIAARDAEIARLEALLAD